MSHLLTPSSLMGESWDGGDARTREQSPLYGPFANGPPLHKVVNAIKRAAEVGNSPLVVSVDGRSGAGKTTFASLVANATCATVVPVDDFYAVAIPDAAWNRMTPKERWANVFCWQSLRSDAIEPMLSGKPGRWYSLDFAAGPRNDGTYGKETNPTVLPSAPIIILDGVYSAGPQLADLVNLAILVEAPEQQRRARLVRREEATFLAQWHARWDAVEDFYFSQIRPRNSFDLIVST